MKLVLINFCFAAPIDPLAGDSTFYSSDSSGYIAFKLFAVYSVRVCIDLILDDSFFWLWGHMIDIFYLWLVTPKLLNFFSIYLVVDTVVASIFFNGRVFPAAFHICLLPSYLNAGGLDLMDLVTLVAAAFLFSSLCVPYGGLAKNFLQTHLSRVWSKYLQRSWTFVFH